MYASLTPPGISRGPQWLGSRLHNPRSRLGSKPRWAPRPSPEAAPIRLGAERVRAAVGPSHCDTTAPAQSPPAGRHMLPAPTAGGRPARQPLCPGRPPPPASSGEKESDSRSAPSLLCSRPAPSLFHSRGGHARISAWLSPPSHTCLEGARAHPPAPGTPPRAPTTYSGAGGGEVGRRGQPKHPERRCTPSRTPRRGRYLSTRRRRPPPLPPGSARPGNGGGRSRLGLRVDLASPPGAGAQAKATKRPPPTDLPPPEGCGNPAPAPSLPRATAFQAATDPIPDSGREPRAPTLGWCEDPQILDLRRAAAWRTKPPAASRSLRKNVQLPSPWD